MEKIQFLVASYVLVLIKRITFYQSIFQQTPLTKVFQQTPLTKVYITDTTSKVYSSRQTDKRRDVSVSR